MSKSKAPGLKQKNSTKRLVTAYPIQARVKPIGRADFSMKVIVQRDFSFNSPTYCEVCFGSTECTQRWRRFPRSARFASAFPAHITVVVDQVGLLLSGPSVEELSVV